MNSTCIAALLSAALLSSPISAQGTDTAAPVSPSVERRLQDNGGTAKVWIELTDKGYADDAARATALEQAKADLSRRALERRALRRTFDGLVDFRDLPVAERYVTRIERLGAEVHVRSSWLNAISATVDREQLGAIRELPFVRAIDLVRRGQRTYTRVSPAEDVSNTFYGMSQTQLDLINLTTLHSQGFTGQGMVIGVLDTGFLLTHDAYNEPGNEINVLASWDFVDNDPVVGPEPGDPPSQHDHGTMILGIMAAYLPNTLVGAAYDASYILAKTEDTSAEYPAEEDFYVAGLEFVENNGADVATSSLGYIAFYTQSDLDGLTAKSTIGVNVATGNGMFCCTAAGNGGNDINPATSSLIAPADAFDVITVGAVWPTQEVSVLSSDGPTADGRLKPEVMAQGEIVFTVSPTDDSAIVSADGTSMSTPQIAGTVACLAQSNPAWDIPTVRERLFKTASYLGLTRPDPLFVYGWGIANAAAARSLAGTWQGHGGGIAGTNGFPQLAGSGPLVGTEPVSMSLSSARPSAAMAYILGLSAINLPFRGGMFVPSPDASIPVSSDPAGAFDLSFPWFPGLPSGFALYSQVWILDPNGTLGLAASNGLSGTTP